MNRANMDIRRTIFEAGLTLTAIAREVGVNRCTLSVWMSGEMTAERRERVLAAIERLTSADGGTEDGN